MYIYKIIYNLMVLLPKSPEAFGKLNYIFLSRINFIKLGDYEIIILRKYQL